MKFDDVYKLLKEVADLPPPMVSVDSAPVIPNKHFTSNNKAFNIPKTKSSPSTEEYFDHFVKYEGKKMVPYKDSLGFLTVGIGHKFEKGEPVKASYSEKEVLEFFKTDLNGAIAQTKKVFPNFENLPKDVKIKLVSLTFNMGMGGVSKFRNFRAAVSKMDWKTAANELRDSRWYNQVGNRGRDYVSFFSRLTG